MVVVISRSMLPTLIVVAALGVYRLVVVTPERPAIVLECNEPVTIGPRYDDPRVVTENTLRRGFTPESD